MSIGQNLGQNMSKVRKLGPNFGRRYVWATDRRVCPGGRVPWDPKVRDWAQAIWARAIWAQAEVLQGSLAEKGQVTVALGRVLWRPSPTKVDSAEECMWGAIAS